jgi:TetR/AcrR family transcriptional repressor of nem operon
MPRTREFEENAVLTAAMHAFRRDGYGGVSIQALAEATGLSSGSLYHAFGGKDAIFAQACAHYNRTVVRRRVRDHLESKPPGAGLRSLFLSLLHEPDGGASGCLVTNSAVEFGGGKSVARPYVRAGMRILEAGFRAVVDRFVAEHGCPPPYSNPRQAREHIGLRLLVLYQGLLVLIRSGASRAELTEFINTEIDLIFGSSI